MSWRKFRFIFKVHSDVQELGNCKHDFGQWAFLNCPELTLGKATTCKPSNRAYEWVHSICKCFLHNCFCTTLLCLYRLVAASAQLARLHCKLLGVLFFQCLTAIKVLLTFLEETCINQTCKTTVQGSWCQHKDIHIWKARIAARASMLLLKISGTCAAQHCFAYTCSAFHAP